jgi:TolA-binding protein
MRKFARYSFAVLIGVAGTLAWQSDEAVDTLKTWVPSLGLLLPASTVRAPAPIVTSVELQQQLKPMMVELAITRRSIEQLAANQDQSARKQEQIVQAINTLQAAEQDISQKISNLPSQKAARVQPAKPVLPDAQ